MKYSIEDLKPIILEAVKDSLSMKEAASKTNLNFKTFAKYAKILGVYNPNQSGKGMSKVSRYKIPLSHILEGKHPQYSTYKLKIRLFKENIKERKCEVCGLSTWMDKPIPLELHHINGNSGDHTIHNLCVICPNCHAQTSNYRGKNIKKRIPIPPLRLLGAV